MPEAQTIATPQVSDVVTFTILSDGEEIPSTVRVQAVTVWQEMNRVPRAELVILDGAPAEQTFAVSETDLFIPGKEIEVLAGYHSDEELIFKGIVVNHKIKARKNGRSHLIVECAHPCIKMTRIRKSRYFYDTSESDVWESIINAYNITPEVDSLSFTPAQTFQYQSTDWDFILSRAEAYGKFVIPDTGGVSITVPAFDEDPVETVTFGATLLAFDAEIDAMTQLPGVTGRTWDFSKTEAAEIDAGNSNPVTPGDLTGQEIAEAIGDETLTLRNSSKQYDEQLQAWADSTLLRHQLAKVRGRAQFQGIASAKAGAIIELQGLGSRFNGKALISGVRHSLSNGNWLADVQFGLSTEQYAARYPVTELSNAGLSPAINGLQFGIVTQLEGDPDGDDRILVNLPIVDSGEQGVWARIATHGAGDSRGVFIRPEIGDEVILGFVNDDPQQAVVIGSVNSSNLPSPIPPSDDNHEKGWVTRSEMRFIVNDDHPSLTVELPSGRMITLSDEASEISIKDGEGNTITMNSDGIAMESASDIVLKATGDVKIEGMNIEAKANTNMKLEANATAEFSGSGSAAIQGGIVQIN